jgi:hypothetical protein
LARLDAWRKLLARRSIMGNWHISIYGAGSHHNREAGDADQIARRLVQELRAAGQTIHDASFTIGQREVVDEPVKPSEPAAVSPAAQPMP